LSPRPKVPAAEQSDAEVTLSHRDKVFSLEFAALDYTFPRRNQYAYSMTGFNDRWKGRHVLKIVVHAPKGPHAGRRIWPPVQGR